MVALLYFSWVGMEGTLIRFNFAISGIVNMPKVYNIIYSEHLISYIVSTLFSV